MGNKQRIVDEILPIMLSNYKGHTFVDVFCGSCSVIEKVPNNYKRIANDKQYATSKNFDYEKFYTWCRALKDDGHTVFVSEYEMPSDFKCVWKKEVTNSLNPTLTKKPTEKLFTL